MKKKIYSRLFVLLNKIDAIDIYIDNIFTKTRNKYKNLIEWKINRLNWYKNRYIFYFLFIVRIIPKKFLCYLNNLKKIDTNLIKIWKFFNFKNLCSFKIFLSLNFKTYFNNVCLFSFVKKVINLNFKVFTGCVCCTALIGNNSPIWWNEQAKFNHILSQKIHENNFVFFLTFDTVVKIFLLKWSFFDKKIDKTFFLFNYKSKLKRKKIFVLKLIWFYIYLKCFTKKKFHVYYQNFFLYNFFLCKYNPYLNFFCSF
nr:G10 protein, predict nuclear transcrption regulator [Cryptomonas paramecium]